ncbi:putative acetylxylan esterase A [Grifola frondosa]|uniref:Putative acetylxylan esterase A n=1 Tax=Grifola frondosa TaxID=5627 RepID=A0A1C7MTE5_GRIFR|nr:putative acetylxylan esterase A [Grifola frondosa]
MFVYIPDQIASPPPVLVALHYCTGTAQAYYTGTQYASLADQYGYIVIYPNAPAGAGGCWDVHTNATLTHNAGGDSLGIASTVRYALSTWGADANRVSSLAQLRSDDDERSPWCLSHIFKGGAAFSGVPYGCFEGPDMWNTACALGEVIKTPQEWGDLVRSGYPGFTGTRPKMQVWHGTIDTTLYPENLWEEIKQWTNVLGYCKHQFRPRPILPSPTTCNTSGDVLTFFGLDTTTPSSTVSTPPTSPTAVPTGGAGTVAEYGQCGGIGWTGATVCVSPFTCTVLNSYYSQCL